MLVCVSVFGYIAPSSVISLMLWTVQGCNCEWQNLASEHVYNDCTQSAFSTTETSQHQFLLRVSPLCCATLYECNGSSNWLLCSTLNIWILLGFHSMHSQTVETSVTGIPMIWQHLNANHIGQFSSHIVCRQLKCLHAWALHIIHEISQQFGNDSR